MTTIEPASGNSANELHTENLESNSHRTQSNLRIESLSVQTFIGQQSNKYHHKGQHTIGVLACVSHRQDAGTSVAKFAGRE